MKRRPYTPDEVEKAHIGANEMPKSGARETILRLIDTIKELRRDVEKARRPRDAIDL